MPESTVLTTLLKLVVDWLKTKTAASRRKDALDESMKHLQFLEHWHRIRIAVCPNESDEIRNLVVRELDAIRERVKVIGIPPLGSAPSLARAAVMAELNRIIGWFLLSKPKRPISWLLRALFYVSVLLVVNEACWIVYLMIGDVSVLNAVLDLDGWGGVFNFFFSISAIPRLSLNFCILLAASLAARRFAIFVDEKREAAIQQAC